ncbi:MAG: ABC transporter substrate-binding protein [Desulfohalobiaceae bacterium]
MKKVVLAILWATLLLACAGPLLGSGHGEHSPSIQRIKDRGKLVVAMFGQDIPPFFMHDQQGRFYGLDVEMARDIADKLGVEVEFNRQAQSFDQIIEILARHEADVGISWISQTLERAEKVRYTQPYFMQRQGLLINRLKLAQLPKKDNPLQALNHTRAKVGVRDGTSYVDFAQDIFPRAEIRAYSDWSPDIVQAVFEGELTAGYSDEIEIKKYIMQNPETSIKARTAIIQDLTDPIAMAVPWDSHGLLDWLNIYIQNHAGDWDAAKLLRKYRDALQGRED